MAWNKKFIKKRDQWQIRTAATMKPPSREQSEWAAESRDYVTQFYEESTRDGFGKFTPMLQLIDHIRKQCGGSLSAGTSLAHLIVASAAHVQSPNALNDDAPRICVTLRDNEFEFRDAKGRRRKCPIEDGNTVFDIQLVRLQMMANAYEDNGNNEQE